MFWFALETPFKDTKITFQTILHQEIHKHDFPNSIDLSMNFMVCGHFLVVYDISKHISSSADSSVG